MAVVAMVTSGDRRIYALPGELADVEMVYGSEYVDEDDEYEIPISMKLPTELLQQVYHHLSSVDFNSARHHAEEGRMVEQHDEHPITYEIYTAVEPKSREYHEQVDFERMQSVELATIRLCGGWLYGL
ncbi:hypothetical protein ACHAQJ_001166 [Trichoderma viride]